ncbi:hypothetical protein SADUNF_Sadunf12G0031000 [Salix dunnii]|uniref:Uncharacterized protein n=1 Tax=Salix dunnii TaxID=1413687 RepID=A0A835JL76_9ROSI|nr:hypothetical protein SADUNF_Sadunf12G0031000 [Salix dunnii]
MEHKRASSEKKDGGAAEEQLGFPVHNQVKKIKQESCYRVLDWLPAGQPEMRPVLKVLTTRSHQDVNFVIYTYYFAIVSHEVFTSEVIEEKLNPSHGP